MRDYLYAFLLAVPFAVAACSSDGPASQAANISECGGDDDPPCVCIYDGTAYAADARFDDADGCNTCTCYEDGSVACTELACVSTCEYGDERYWPGDTFDDLDGCNTCACTDDGSIVCTELACPVTCSYGGKTYLPGDSFPDEDNCNTCACQDDGSIVCTARYCL